jgi:hypothetical protein
MNASTVLTKTKKKCVVEQLKTCYFAPVSEYNEPLSLKTKEDVLIFSCNHKIKAWRNDKL